jgi:hypothetical protein
LTTGSSLEAINAYETLVFRSEQKRLEHGARNRISGGELNVHNSRIYGHGDQTLHEVQAGEPFGIEVNLTINRPLQQPIFSLAILNAAGILCKWNASERYGPTEAGACGTFTLRVWYPENHLMNGAYEAHFEVQDGTSRETLERIPGIVSFAVIGPRRARGIVAGPCHWELLPFTS